MKRLLSFFATVVLLGPQSLQAQWIQTSGLLRYIQCIAVKGLNLFAATDGGVFRSTNNGTSWTPVNTGISDLSVLSLAVHGSNLFVGTNKGVFLFIDNGTSWTIVNTGLANLGVSSLAVQGSNLFVAGYYEHDHDDEVEEDKGVFLFIDNGTSWTLVNTGLTNTHVVSLAVNGSNLFAGTYGGVFLSTNNGTSWVNTGLSNTPVWSLAVNGSNVFVGTYDGGVFLSTNPASRDTSWAAVNTGLPSAIVSSLVVSGSCLFAGTGHFGVWRRPLSEMVTGVEDDFREVPTNIIVSSQLIERNRPSDTYKAENLTDGNNATAWAEGTDGAGIGEWIKFSFDVPRKIKAIKILAGYAKTEGVYLNNNRVKKLKVIFSDGEPQIAELKDVNDFQRIIIDRDRPTKFVKLEILEVFKGQKFDDTCISEIDFEFKEQKRHEEVDTLSNADTVAGSSQILSQQITESITGDRAQFFSVPFEGSEEFLSPPSGDEVLQLKYERAGKLVTLVDNDLTIEVEFDSISSEETWVGRFGIFSTEFSIIKRLSFAIHGQEVEIPIIAYSDLANINYDRPDQFFLSRTGENYFMSIGGGAYAGESYAAIFIIQGHNLVRREVWSPIGGEATSGRIEFE